LLREEKSLNERLLKLEEAGGDDRAADEAKEELSTQLADVHTRLAEMEAESGPARAALLLAGLSITSFLDKNAHMPFRSWIFGI
jgi:ATP-binding cassette subfamily F protein 3